MGDYEQLVLDHMELAEKVARKTRQRLPHYARTDDITADAYLGLVQAAQRWNGGGAFIPYALMRIRGAIVDGLRERCASRGAVKNGVKYFPWEDHLAPEDDGGVEAVIDELAVSQLRQWMTQREWVILWRWYFERELGKDIGADYGITQQRVVQIRKAVIHRLKLLV